MRVRKLPVEVDAVQWLGHTTDPPIHAVHAYRRPGVPRGDRCGFCGLSMRDHGQIDTLEGAHTVCPTDWIITGVEGEQYPCKDVIFRKTYELVEEVSVRWDLTLPDGSRTHDPR